MKRFSSSKAIVCLLTATAVFAVLAGPASAASRHHFKQSKIYCIKAPCPGQDRPRSPQPPTTIVCIKAPCVQPGETKPTTPPMTIEPRVPTTIVCIKAPCIQPGEKGKEPIFCTQSTTACEPCAVKNSEFQAAEVCTTSTRATESTSNIEPASTLEAKFASSTSTSTSTIDLDASKSVNVPAVEIGTACVLNRDRSSFGC